jgi:hypothetical protein
LIVEPVNMVVVLRRYMKTNTDFCRQPMKNIAKANSFNATTAILKEVYTAMNVRSIYCNECMWRKEDDETCTRSGK